MAQDLPRSQQPGRVFLDFFAAGELALVGPRLHDALVADAHGDEVGDALWHRQRALHDHAEDAELRRKELPGATARPFDEELERKPVADETPHVGVYDRGVEAVALERSPDEECASP